MVAMLSAGCQSENENEDLADGLKDAIKIDHRQTVRN